MAVTNDHVGWAKINNAGDTIIERTSQTARFDIDNPPDKPEAPGKPYWLPIWREVTDQGKPVEESRSETIEVDRVQQTVVYRDQNPGESDAEKDEIVEDIWLRPETQIFFQWCNNLGPPTLTEQQFKDNLKALL